MPETPTDTRILVVDDEPKIVRLLREVLTGAGESAVKMAALEHLDLVLLDIILAGTSDGYEVARQIREFSDVPIIMLTAKARESDLLRGFDAGADDYLTKPFSSHELLVRVRALLKRARREAAGPVRSEISCGELRIDLARRRVALGDRIIRLTPTEYDLLRALADHANQVML